MKRTLIAFTAGAIIVGSLTYAFTGHTDKAEAQPPVTKAVVLNEETILRNLTKSAELVTLTGEAEKTIPYINEKWYGDQQAFVHVEGPFKLGVATAKIEVATSGNVVKIRLPQPELISLSLPYDTTDVHKSSGMFRKDVSEETTKALYKKAEKAIRKDIANDKKAQDKAEANAEKVVRGLVLKINNVEAVVFE
ncbi:DUF4230 domain-containing protein [Priestia megaterium]|uniref:DUF4230 domain-containing protein n=1 Tax=Priestia megaterium TaxID=1404 RepID=UPI001E0FAF87|nr:DUF4230 domain-containing protein [Priestia megaterium]CAH0304289.1 hypothetical protein SRABI82_04667 [Priestia megaterium]